MGSKEFFYPDHLPSPPKTFLLFPSGPLQRPLGLLSLHTFAQACNTHSSSAPSLTTTPTPSSLKLQTLQRPKYCSSWGTNPCLDQGFTRICWWAGWVFWAEIPKASEPTITLCHTTHCPGHFCSRFVYNSTPPSAHRALPTHHPLPSSPWVSSQLKKQSGLQALGLALGPEAGCAEAAGRVTEGRNEGDGLVSLSLALLPPGHSFLTYKMTKLLATKVPSSSTICDATTIQGQGSAPSYSFCLPFDTCPSKSSSCCLAISYCGIEPFLCHHWSQNLSVTEHQR